MALFLVVGFGGNESLGKKISDEFPTTSRNLTVDTWLVVAPGTAKDISDKIGISEGQTGSGMVTNVGGYWGRASADLWEWMKATASTTNV